MAAITPQLCRWVAILACRCAVCYCRFFAYWQLPESLSNHRIIRVEADVMWYTTRQSTLCYRWPCELFKATCHWHQRDLSYSKTSQSVLLILVKIDFILHFGVCP